MACPRTPRRQLLKHRTQLALGRTLLSWVRTVISLITFGYAIYKVIDAVRPDPSSSQLWLNHRGFGLIMISVGLVSLVLGTYEHRRDEQKLWADYPTSPRRSSRVRVLSGLVAALGFLAFVVMIFRS